jgi:DeoR family transcriptional regulator of aga operon
MIEAHEGGPPAPQRRERILAVVRERDFARVTDLSEMFGISTVTVRSDLDSLENEGQLLRVRGGAVARTLPRKERPFEETEATSMPEKTAIGQAAADLVSSNETIILDVGTTTTSIARALVAREDLHDVVIITNGLNIALELEAAAPRFTVVVTGGTLRPLQHSLVDPLGGLILDRINANTVFVGCNGVDRRRGITNINLPEAEMKRRMLGAARYKVVVADGSKVGQVEIAHLCDIDEIDLLIAGDSADPELVAELREVIEVTIP